MRSFSPLFEEAAAGGSGGGGGDVTLPAGSAPAGGQGNLQGGQGSAVPEPWYKEWLGSDGKVNAKAYERMPEHLRHLAPSLANAGTIDDVFTKMAHLNTLAGKKGLGPLPSDAPAEAVKAHNELMRSVNGVPDKPEGYGIAKPSDLPDIAWNSDLAGASAQILHKYNVPPGAAKELVALQVESAKKQLAAQATYEAQFFANQEKRVKEQFSLDGIVHEQGMELASRTARTFGIDPDKDPIFKNAQVVLMLQRAGIALGEDRLITGENPGANDGKDDAARAEDIIHNKANPENKIYWDGQHPQNKAVKQKVAALLEADARRKQAARGGRR